MMPCFKPVATLLATVAATASLGADPPLAVTLDGAPFPASLAAIDDGSVTWQADQGPESTSLRRLIYWGACKSQDPGPEILFADGSVLRLRQLQDLEEIDRTHLTVESAVWQRLRLRRSSVAVVMLNPPAITREFHALRDRLLAEKSLTEVILLLNGDQLLGSIQRVDRSGALIRLESQDLNIALDRIQAIRLASPARKVSEQIPELVAIGLRDGSLIQAAIERLDASQLRLKLRSGATIRAHAHVQPLEEVVFLRSLNERVVYLTNLTVIGYKHIPYLSLEWPYRLDRNVLGGPLRVGAVRFDKGVGMHSASRLAFSLPSASDRFEAELAIDESSEGRGSVTFRVFLDRNGAWSPVFQSTIVRGGERPIPCRVDVRGAESIALVVDFAERGDQGDHANWLNARVIRP